MIPKFTSSKIARLTFIVLLTVFAQVDAHAQARDYRYNKVVEYFNAGSLQSAFDLAMAMKQDAEANYPQGSSKQFDAVYLIALIMTQAGAYDQCELLLADYVVIWPKGSSENLMLSYCAIENYRLWGQTRQGIAIAEEVVAAYKNSGVFSIDYYNALNSLGLLYFNGGRYAEAEVSLLECKAFYGSNLMMYEVEYQRQNNNLGLLYTNWNRYQDAEELLNECLAFREIYYGENSPLVATTVNNLGAVYLNSMQYRKAYNFYERSYNIRASLYGKKHDLSIQSLNNMATVAFSSEDYALADSLITIVLGEWKTSLGEESNDYLTALNTKAAILMQANKLDSARILLENIYETQSRLYGEESIILQNPLSSLSELEFREKNYPASTAYTRKNYSIAKSYFGEESPLAYDLLLSAALSLEKESKFREADSLVVKWYAFAMQDFTVLVGSGSAESNKAVLDERKVNFATAAAYTKRNHRRNNSLLKTTLDGEINFRNWQLFSLSKWDKLIKEQKNNELNLDYATWKELRTTYANMLNFGNSNLDELNLLKKRIDQLEVKIKQSLPNAGSLFTLVSYKEIAKKLGPNQVGIQIIYNADFDAFNNQLINRTYEALVFKNDAVLHWITLCDADKIENWYNATTNLTDRGWAYRGANDVTEESELDTLSNSLLTQLIWEPLASILENSDEIIYAADGVFNAISLASVPIGDSIYMVDRYKISLRTTLTNITENPKKHKSTSVLLYGGIDYQHANTTLETTSKTTDATLPSTESINGFGYLKGTLEEVYQVSTLLEKNKAKAIARTGKYCSEKQFIEDLKQKPRILHLATHGFYISTENQHNMYNLQITVGATNKFELARDPLMRSGLVLAGGNMAWLNQDIDSGANNDGILTALDLEKLDLSATELIILSACETGLGDLTYGQGVFGLQSAVKRADGDYMIIALWKISDAATVEIISKFYESWLVEENIEGAFQYAQQQLRQTYPPSIWGAFQLVK